MRGKIALTTCMTMAFLGLSATGETLIGEASASGDLSSLNPPMLYGQEINPDDPWRGRLRRVWGGALDIYRDWDSKQVAVAPVTKDSGPTPVPTPSAALSGLALLGSLGGARAMRRPRLG